MVFALKVGFFKQQKEIEVNTKTRLLILIVATIIVLSMAAIASAQEGENVSCPPCDASLEVMLTPRCLDGSGFGSGVLTVTNTGEQGISLVTLEAWLIKGTGVITPNIASFELGPGESASITFTLNINETSRQLGDGAQLEWKVTAESCRPWHNIGRRDRQDFPWCPPPTIVKLSSLATQSVSTSDPRILIWMALIMFTVTLLATIATLAYMWYQRRR
jgi:hypothetical protein